MDIRGLGVVVTGASRGLGLSLSAELAKEGARVVMVARHEAPLREAARSITRQGGVAHALALDIADKSAVHALAGAASALAGPIDVVIHNASSLGKVPMPLLLDTDCEDFEAVLAANLIGPFRITKALAGAMILRKRGLLIHLSSDAAVSAYPKWGAYGVSKAALDHLARVWAAELEGTGVRVLSIDPGEMDTAMHADALPDADRTTLADPADVARRIVAMIRHAETLESGTRLLVAASVPEVSP